MVQHKIIIKPEAYISAAFVCLLVPWKWLIAWLLASSFHELCHYIAIRVCRRHIVILKIGISGADMCTEPLLPREEGFCAAAGPIGSFLLLLLVHILPRVAICGLFQGAYNLLPIYPMDGGRIIRSLLPVNLSEQYACVIGNTTICILVGILLYGAIHLKLGLLPLFVSVVLLRKIKIPCKQKRLRVQ